MFKPKKPLVVYQDCLGRPFNVQDALLLNFPVSAQNGIILLLQHLKHDTVDGRLAIQGKTMGTHTPITFPGEAGKPISGVYRIGTTDEILAGVMVG
jgi:hypothetical protein